MSCKDPPPKKKTQKKCVAILCYLWSKIANLETNVLVLLFSKDSFCNWSIWYSTFVNGSNKTFQKNMYVSRCNFWTYYAIFIYYKIFNLQKIYIMKKDWNFNHLGVIDNGARWDRQTHKQISQLLDWNSLGDDKGKYIVSNHTYESLRKKINYHNLWHKKDLGKHIFK